ncbi:MAG: MmcQ/YjbR family DNA-binding protein [Firmicutes bacterium]|nr:MmcQ/YjbR family DNA-binding protein [Bacillota bacterium]
MRFEERYFLRKIPDLEKLKAYGFRQEADGSLKYEKLLREETFRAELAVDPAGAVRGQLIDLEFGDEFYQIHSDNQRGAFVAEICEEYGELLEEIAEAGFIPQPFILAQSNRIARRVLAEFGEKPVFPFKKIEGAGVFENPDNGKWYGLIMEVDRNKLKKPGTLSGGKARGSSQNTGSTEDMPKHMTEAMNVKVRPETVPELTKREGIYECYHMNKKHWVTVVLEDEVPDEDIMSLLRESRSFTLGKRRTASGRRKGSGEQPAGKSEGPRKWLMPANVNRFDVPGALAKDPVILWKHGTRVKPGDLVYLYFSAPVSAIRYRFRVLESDIEYHFSEERMNERGEKAMRMELLQEFVPPFSISEMRKFGVGPVRGPRFMPEELERQLMKGK